ncbi:MAG: DUF58 domain-containing protein [bacterium]
MIPKEILKKIKRIEITTRKLVNTVLQGEYLSSFKGRGIEFTEVREYVEGDDVRAIDWNVTARMNAPFIKTFVEERELQVVFAADLSGSLASGTGDNLKKDIMFEFIAALAFTANLNNDRVGFMGFTSEVEKYVPPKKGKKHTLRIIREILNPKLKGTGTDINDALIFLRHILKKRSTIFVVSDFYDEKDFNNGLKILKHNNDLIAVVLRDKTDSTLPDIGMVPVYDSETKTLRWLNTSNRTTLKEYSKESIKADGQLFRKFKTLGIDYMVLNSGESYINALTAFFRKRERMSGR